MTSMGDQEAERKAFIERLRAFNDERGYTSNPCPTISKQSLDLYLLYSTIKARGGFVAVSKARHWKDCAQYCNLTLNSSAAYTLKKQYIKHLLPYECHFDRNGVDPQELVQQTEPGSKKKHGKGSAPSPGPGDSNSQGSLSSNSTTCSSSYPTSGTPNAASTTNSEVSNQSGSQGVPSGGQFPPNQQCPPTGYPPQSHANMQGNQGPMSGYAANAAPPSGSSIPGGYSMIQGGHPAMPHHPGYPPHSAYNGQSYGQPPPPQTYYPPGHPGHQPVHQWQGNQHPPTVHHQQPYPGQPPLQPQAAPSLGPPSAAPSTAMPSSSGQHAWQGHPNQHPNQTVQQHPPGHHQWQGHHLAPPTSSVQQQPQTPTSGGQSISVQDPFSDEIQTPSSSYSRNQGVSRATPPSTSIPAQQAVPSSQSTTGMPPHSVYNGQSYGQPHAGQTGYQGGQRHPPPRSTPPTTPNPPPATSMAGQSSGHPPAPPSGYPGQYGYSASPQYQMPNDSRFPRPDNVDYNRPPGHHPNMNPDQGFRQQQPQSYYGQQQPQHPGQQPTAPNVAQQGVQQQQPQRPAYGDFRAYPPMNRPDMPPYQPGQQHPQQQSYYGQQPTQNQQGIQGPQQQSTPTGPQTHPSQQHPPRQGFGDYRDSRAYPPMSRPEMPHYGSHVPPQSGHSIPPHHGSSGPSQSSSHSISVTHGPPRPAGPPPLSAPGVPTTGPMAQSMPPSLYGPNRGENAPPTRYPMGPPVVPPQPGHPMMGHPGQHPHQHPGHRPMAPPSSLPSQQQPFQGGPGMMMMPHQMMMRKEITFPPGSVEATQPIMVKKRKITARDISQIEAWRILMSLKSGLLAESTWALDVLTVLAFDDNTFSCFVLNGMPGLLDTLLEHYKKCLSRLFHGLLDEKKDAKKSLKKSMDDDAEEGIQSDSETSSGSSLCRFRIRKSKSLRSKKWYEIDEDVKENSEPLALLEVESIDPCRLDNSSTTTSVNHHYSLPSSSLVSSPINEVNKLSNEWLDKTNHKLANIPSSMTTKAFPLKETQVDEKREDEGLVLLTSAFNFTNRSRDGKPVKITESKDLSMSDLEKKWSQLHKAFFNEDECLTNDSGFDQDWDESQHILTQFASKRKSVRFVRVMDSSKDPEDVSFNNVNGETKPVDNQIVEEKEIESQEQEYPRFRDRRKRKHDVFDDFEEEEAFERDHGSLYPVDEYSEGLSRRCLVLSTLIRNLSFVSGNEGELARHQGVMKVLSRLLLLNHEHPIKSKSMKQPPIVDDLTTDESLFNDEVAKEQDSEQEADLDSCEWYYETINILVENSLVTLANVSGLIDLSPFPEDVSLPLLDGLLHWSVCPSSYAQDHLPMTSMTNLSPARLALETLVKLSIREGNVDLMLATPPWERLDRLFKTLAKMLARNEDQTLREFALVMLVNMSTADTSIARAVALTGNAIPQLISFVEQSEQSAMSVAQSHGVNALRENPEMMGTTLDMVRRASLCLRALARIPDNRPLFAVYQQRLLNLVMSQILDQGVAAIMADVMFECSLSDPTLHATRDVFLPYITPLIGETHRPLTPPAPASSTASMVNGDHHQHIKDSSGNHETPSHAPLVNSSSHSNGSSSQVNNGSLEVKSVLPELLKRELTNSPTKAVSPIVMNGCLDSPTSNHLDSLNERPKIELSKVPPAVKLENSLKGIETTPVVAVNHLDLKNNGTNSGEASKGCPRLKELLLSYQMSPKFEGHESPTTQPQEQMTT